MKKKRHHNRPTLPVRAIDHKPLPATLELTCRPKEGPAAAGSPAPPAPPAPPTPSPAAADGACARAKRLCLKHFLVLGLLLAIVAGVTVPAAGEAVASWKACSGLLGCVGVVQTVCVVVIFLISGLTLKTDEVKRALTSWPDALFGVVSILLITPLLALLPTRLRFLPAEFQVGFLLFCSMPTTINSGVALVGTGRGNVAMALLLTLASNLLGVFTVPFSLSLLLQVSDVRIDASPLLAKLLMMILLPLLLGKAARDWSPRLRERLKQRKQLVSNGSSLLLCLIPWMKLSQSEAAPRPLPRPRREARA